MRLWLAVIAGGLALVPVSAEPQPCNEWEVEYAVVANLKVSDTALHKGDGVYPIGPGKLVLLYKGDDVQLLSYTMHQKITVRATLAFWSVTMVAEADNTAIAQSCGNVGEATISNRQLTWRSPVRNHRTNGTMICTGSGCGMFGAPPAGTSKIEHGPTDAHFGTFHFSGDMTTFTMPVAPPLKTESPKQTSQLAMSGREIRRTCVSSRCR